MSLAARPPFALLPRPPARWAAATVAATLAATAGITLAATAGGGADEPPAPASVYGRRSAAARLGAAVAAITPAAAGGDDAAQAERIVISSLRRIADAESVAIRLRQRVRIGDRVLVGVGRYLQAGRGEEQRFRFETTLQSDSESFEVTEVNDGLFCWLHRRTGPDPAGLHRIDVQRVRSKLQQLGAADPADTAAYVGGLQRNLWWARQWFRFAAAVPAELEDGRGVWLAEGRWQPGMLELLLPELAAAAKRPGGIQPEDLPDGFPWTVRLAVDRGDLLPRRLEFLAIPGTRPVRPGPVEPIAVVDFLEIELDAAVDATAFFYQPASEELVDITDHVVQTMTLMRP